MYVENTHINGYLLNILCRTACYLEICHVLLCFTLLGDLSKKPVHLKLRTWVSLYLWIKLSSVYIWINLSSLPLKHHWVMNKNSQLTNKFPSIWHMYQLLFVYFFSRKPYKNKRSGFDETKPQIHHLLPMLATWDSVLNFSKFPVSSCESRNNNT